MKIQELREALSDLGVDPRAVGIDGVNLSDEQYRLEKKEGGYWVVYYSERGQETGLREFASEESACEYFMQLVSRDETARLTCKS